MQSVGEYLLSWYHWPANFRGSNGRAFLDAYPDYPVYATVLYLACVFYLPGLLKRHNKTYTLKWLVAGWNLSLSLVSTIGAYHSVWLAYASVYEVRSFYLQCCEFMPTPDDDPLTGFTKSLHEERWRNEPLEYRKLHPNITAAEDLFAAASERFYNGPHAFYSALFMYLKTPELLDTVFLILQGKPVSFLHWFHHILTAVYAWHSAYVLPPSGVFISAMNYFVHSIMYFYYFLVVMGYRKTIRPFAPVITLLQLSQMFIGVYITLFMYLHHYAGAKYAGTWFYRIVQAVCLCGDFARQQLLSLYRNQTLLAPSSLRPFVMAEHFYGCHVDHTNLRMSLMMFTCYCVLFGVLFKELYLDKRANEKSIVRGQSGKRRESSSSHESGAARR